MKPFCANCFGLGGGRCKRCADNECRGPAFDDEPGVFGALEGPGVLGAVSLLALAASQFRLAGSIDRLTKKRAPSTKKRAPSTTKKPR